MILYFHTLLCFIYITILRANQESTNNIIEYKIDEAEIELVKKLYNSKYKIFKIETFPAQNQETRRCYRKMNPKFEVYRVFTEWQI